MNKAKGDTRDDGSSSSNSEDGEWEPLVVVHNNNSSGNAAATTTTTTRHVTSATTTTATTTLGARKISRKSMNDDDTHACPSIPPRPTATEPAAASSSNQNELTKSRERFRRLQRRLDDSIRLEQHLVRHPLSLGSTRLGLYFVLELWTTAGWTRRTSLALIVVGLCLQWLWWITTGWWYFFYPRVVLLAVLFVGGYLYLCHADDILQSPQTWFLSFQQGGAAVSVTTTWSRRMTVASFLVPTILEMKALHILSRVDFLVHDETTTTTTTAALFVVSLSSLIVSIWWWHYRNYHQPRAVTRICWIVLYLCAVFTTVWNYRHHEETGRTVALVAPLCTTLGVVLLLLQQDGEWLARSVRQALRLALRDVLQQVSNDLQQDELLQLALLRWIVDYWSTTSTTTSSTTTPPAPANRNQNNQEPQQANQPTTTMTSADDDSSLVSTHHGRPSSNGTVVPPSPRLATTTSTAGTTSNDSARNNRNALASTTTNEELQWGDLFTMLDRTTLQLENEVQFFQTEQQHQSTAASSGTTNHPSTNNSNNNHGNSNENYNNDTWESLRVMLSSMDVDEHAQPAVLAYQQAVEAFPPSSPRWAIFISVARRCPAALLLLLHHVGGGDALLFGGSWLVLLPLVVLELLRVQAWARAVCRPQQQQQQQPAVPNDNTANLLVALEQIDPMTILLSDDQYRAEDPPTLLVVWHNVEDSVQALQYSLTAARCVHTTSVAVDFCDNILSLAQFGWQVKQHGWFHGLGVLLQEHGHWQAATPAARRKSVIHAVRSVVPNGQKLRRSLTALQEDENLTTEVANPLVAIMSATVVGCGWLRAGGGNDTALAQDDAVDTSGPVETSTVRIEQLDDDDDDDDDDRVVEKKECDECTITTIEAAGSHPVPATALVTSKPTNSNQEPEKDGPAVTDPCNVQTKLPKNCDVADESHQLLVVPMESQVPVVSATAAPASLAVKQSLPLAKESPSRLDTDAMLACSESKDEPVSRGSVEIPGPDESNKATEEDGGSCSPTDTDALKSHGSSDAKLVPETSKELVPAAPPRSPSPCSDDGFVRIEPKPLEGGAIVEPTTAESRESAAVGSRREALSVELKSTMVESNSVCSDDDFEPLELDPNGGDTPESDPTKNSLWNLSVADAVQQADTSDLVVAKTKGKSTQEKMEEEQDKNLLVQVGGGLAVLGAVVGGVALAAAAMHGNKDNEEGRRRNSKRSAQLE